MTARIRGFFSYSREDDEAELQGLTRLRASIQREIAMRLGLSGKDVELFQDIEKLRTGHDWEKRLESAVREAHFFILISTPRAFRGDSFTRKELSWFLEREKTLADNELVMPLTYLPIPGIEHEDTTDIYVETIRKRQYRRWDHLRHLDERDQLRRSEVDSLAKDICDALGRLKLVRTSPQPTESPSTIATADEADRTSGATTKEGAAAPNPSIQVQATPEIIVDPYGRADCRTIKDAISRAVNGERIVVRKGYYNEELAIDRPVEIVGSGARHEVVITSTTADVVIFNANFGRIAGLTLRNHSPKHNCVDVVQGRLLIENCDLTSEGLAIIAVHDGADPIISQCDIHDGNQGGIYVYDKGRGTYEDNDIHNNTLAGIEVTMEANPIVRRNRIHDGKSSGVFVHDSGRGTYEDNDIYENSSAGISVRGEASPVVRRNNIYCGQQSGVFIYRQGQGVYEDNNIYGNALAGINVSSEANPIVRRNKIYDGRQGGIHIYDKGKGVYEDNDVHSNAFANIAVKLEANPIVRRNHIHDGKQGGIYIYDKARGTYEDNDIHNNTFPNVSVRSEADPIVRRNSIHAGKQAGIRITENGRGTYEDNNVHGNESAGIIVTTSSTPIVRRNHIHSGNDDGIFVLSEGQGVFENNIIEGNRDKGIRLQDNVKPTLNKNTTRNNAGDK